MFKHLKSLFKPKAITTSIQLKTLINRLTYEVIIFIIFHIPRKVSDYMGVRLPVIVPCLKGQLEVIKGNGLCYKPEMFKGNVIL